MEQDSFDSFDDIEEMVMAANNLSLSPNGAMSGDQRDSLNVSGEEDELPKSIIVTNVDLSVFDNLDIKVMKILDVLWPMGSTTQADPSCFFFRISRILME